MPPIVPDAPAVVVDDVHKRFLLPKEKLHTFKERALHPLKRTQFDRLEAVNGVSFAVPHGEFFGIVGRNGSGKSTLLKCMAGIYRIDSGAVYVNGRLSTFIELGVGFNPGLAARDNVMINAIMLGLSRREAAERYERILDFSELHEFQDLKIKNYSSGMLVRLAFSVMIQVDADILLIDEVLAVGDAAFQQKCFDEFNRLRAERRTILFVTHDMASVQRFCDRAMLLERGRMRAIGGAEEIAGEYFQLNFGGAAPAVAAEAGRRGDGSAEVLEGWFEDENGERADALVQGRPCAYCARVRFNAQIVDPTLAMSIMGEHQRPVFATSTVWQSERTGAFAAGEEALLRVAFDNALAPGRYHANTSVARSGGGENVLDHRERLASVLVTGTRPGGGLVDLPHDLAVERMRERV